MTMSDICFIKKGRERERAKERTRGWEREREREWGRETLKRFVLALGGRPECVSLL
jgi:hypothetical protein